MSEQHIPSEVVTARSGPNANDVSGSRSEACGRDDDHVTRRNLQDRMWDLLAAFPLLIWLALGLVGSSMQLGSINEPDAMTRALGLARHGARIALSLALIAVIVVRIKPILKSQTLAQRFTGILGVVIPVTIIGLPRSDLGFWTNFTSLFFLLTGTLGSLTVLFWLGRAFSIMPQARRLVTTGPYRYVRHPLYLAELVTVFGLQLQFRQPWAFSLFLLTLATQIIRMRYEETILTKAFPTYRAYAFGRARLVPGVY